jgi:hypothetical protein
LKIKGRRRTSSEEHAAAGTRTRARSYGIGRRICWMRRRRRRRRRIRRRWI